MKLPSVFANKIDKVIKNNEDYFHGDRNVVKKKVDLNNLSKKFDQNGYVNKLSVLIKTKNGSKLEKLILKKNDYFVNINNEKIFFDDILDYEIK